MTPFHLYVCKPNKKFKNSGGTRFLYENFENHCAASVIRATPFGEHLQNETIYYKSAKEKDQIIFSSMVSFYRGLITGG